MNAYEKLVSEADTMETSTEIMNAITELAAYYIGGVGVENSRFALAYNICIDIWSDPSEEDLLEITEIVTKNGLLPSGDFYWGAAGTEWPADI